MKKRFFSKNWIIPSIIVLSLVGAAFFFLTKPQTLLIGNFEIENLGYGKALLVKVNIASLNLNRNTDIVKAELLRKDNSLVDKVDLCTISSDNSKAICQFNSIFEVGEFILNVYYLKPPGITPSLIQGSFIRIQAPLKITLTTPSPVQYTINDVVLNAKITGFSGEKVEASLFLEGKLRKGFNTFPLTLTPTFQKQGDIYKIIIPKTQVAEGDLLLTVRAKDLANIFTDAEEDIVVNVRVPKIKVEIDAPISVSFGETKEIIVKTFGLNNEKIDVDSLTMTLDTPDGIISKTFLKQDFTRKGVGEYAITYRFEQGESHRFNAIALKAGYEDGNSGDIIVSVSGKGTTCPDPSKCPKPEKPPSTFPIFLVVGGGIVVFLIFFFMFRVFRK
jgi:hypothetical protein